MSGPRLSKVHSIREMTTRIFPYWIKTHCGREGYSDARPNEYGTAAGFVFKAVKVDGPDRRVTCKRCQRRRG